MSKKRHLITERDIEIVRFVNQFGFCTMKHIGKKFNLSHYRSYKVTKRSRILGLIELDKENKIQNKHGFLKVTPMGAKLTPFDPIKTLSLDNYEHQLAIIDVYLRLKEMYPDSEWISERHLIKEKYANGLGKKGHIADGIFCRDSKQIAIEVEFSMKGSLRLQKILKGYISKSFSEVWYFCSPNIISAFIPHTAKLPFVKVFNIEEFLNNGIS